MEVLIEKHRGIIYNNSMCRYVNIDLYIFIMYICRFSITKGNVTANGRCNVFGNKRQPAAAPVQKRLHI